ncbi:hypothetical protein FOCC_FOCC006024 [Frankliniella occidentalis]|nr:hypothetical protein FOCC_FOCC006024 [Frankliniella occidentalis]
MRRISASCRLMRPWNQGCGAPLASSPARRGSSWVRYHWTTASRFCGGGGGGGLRERRARMGHSRCAGRVAHPSCSGHYSHRGRRGGGRAGRGRAGVVQDGRPPVLLARAPRDLSYLLLRLLGAALLLLPQPLLYGGHLLGLARSLLLALLQVAEDLLGPRLQDAPLPLRDPLRHLGLGLQQKRAVNNLPRGSPPGRGRRGRGGGGGGAHLAVERDLLQHVAAAESVREAVSVTVDGVVGQGRRGVLLLAPLAQLVHGAVDHLGRVVLGLGLRRRRRRLLRWRLWRRRQVQRYRRHRGGLRGGLHLLNLLVAQVQQLRQLRQPETKYTASLEDGVLLAASKKPHSSGKSSEQWCALLALLEMV